MAEDLKVQLEHTQTKMREIQASVLDNRNARERESANLKRAQVRVLVVCNRYNWVGIKCKLCLLDFIGGAVQTAT